MSGMAGAPGRPAGRTARWARLAIGALVALALALSLAGLSQVPWTATAQDAELRLAWRARVPRVEECRRLTPEEQAELPVHMRREEVCEGRVASYLLRVEVDGRTVRSDTVVGAGARGDRPLYVSESIHLRPGPHDVAVSFTRLGATAQGARATSGAGETVGVPDRLVLRRRIELESREVALVSYDPDGRRLELRGAGSTR